MLRSRAGSRCSSRWSITSCNYIRACDDTGGRRYGRCTWIHPRWLTHQGHQVRFPVRHIEQTRLRQVRRHIGNALATFDPAQASLRLPGMPDLSFFSRAHIHESIMPGGAPSGGTCIGRVQVNAPPGLITQRPECCENWRRSVRLVYNEGPSQMGSSFNVPKFIQSPPIEDFNFSVRNPARKIVWGNPGMRTRAWWGRMCDQAATCSSLQAASAAT